MRAHWAASTTRPSAASCVPADHPLRPEGYVPLDAFWRNRGFAPVEGMVGQLVWRDIDQEAETAKPMQFWMKALA